MLLEFRVKNYKSFKEEFVFSLAPEPHICDLNYSVLQEKIGERTYRGLCSSVFYGANATGKTNIIEAMETFKKIILRGHIRNVPATNALNVAARQLEYIPNELSGEQNPVSFSISFTTDGILIEYAFAALLGRFLDAHFPRKIMSERLSINENVIFDRAEKLEFGSLKEIEPFLIDKFDSKASQAMAAANLNDEELFLTNGFKVMFSSKLVSMITNWLNNKFVIVYGFDFVEIPTSGSKLCSLLGNKQDGAIGIPVEQFKSHGTLRLLNMFPFIIRVVKNGGILVMDEFDTAIHPMALVNIVNIFHNDELNPNHAQFVFNTHNPIFLNKNLFRRDEIRFVERNGKSHCSEQYSLSDFGTVGDDYMADYLANRYGAIKDIDFSPVVQEAFAHKK